MPTEPVKQDLVVLRKYRVFLGIPMHGALQEHKDVRTVTTVNGVELKVLPLPEPIYITLGMSPDQSMKNNRDSDFAKKDALDRARTLYFREHPEDEGMDLELVALHFIRQFIRENAL